ncbi:tRNA (adenine(37)-N6)-methyltransferase [Chelonus insularis]|uniref:tRNA (adenine(37)-N6)-methyltransferase n=1 Tax=Chelonus insularis TaxID=460826 RepID=UPI00158E92CA|nr:tRNA (adenine(37)-N6)-methyltransferase [Chelonus insularis]
MNKVIMDTASQNSELNPQYLLNQLNIARKEINNLRQQIKSLRYIFEKDVNGIKRLIELHSDGIQAFSNSVIQNQQPSAIESASTSQSNTSISLEPIGIINTGFPNKRGTPRQPGVCKESRGKITLFNSVFTNPDHALNGLHEFSHMWILFHFHRNDSTHVRAKVAPPRLNGARTGVFSTRSPHRPCPIGLSLVKIIKIKGNTILFEGVDTVDGTPVLDIKPYIPQYDNPLHVEQLIRRENSDFNNYRLSPNNIEFNRDLEDEESQEFDVSRDEELAMRLQAEEFQQGPNVYEVNSPLRYSQSSEASLSANNLPENADVFVNNEDTNQDAAAVNQGNSQDTDVLSINEASNLVQNINLESQDSRNSRLLDGADGPRTICVTDMDLINRRALISRLDNSPVRMGVREAPDGEEGLESQSLRPSLTIGNIQNISANVNNTLQNYSSSSNVDVTENSQFQVRVPDWITQPQTRSLSVIFNERAIRQLTEIVNDKADEEKHAIINVLREDPRSVYLRQRWANQFYTFLIHDLHISCKFDDNRGIVTVFQIRHAGRTCECGEPEWQCLGHSPIS